MVGKTCRQFVEFKLTESGGGFKLAVTSDITENTDTHEGDNFLVTKNANILIIRIRTSLMNIIHLEMKLILYYLIFQ